jgi:two-component system, NarL family, sensor histidine kinase UhpB
MIENLSLRSRIMMLLASVLAMGLALGIVTLVLHAGARIRAEAEAATRLGEDFVENALARAATAPDPQAELRRLLAQAQKLRHVRIFLEGDAAPPSQSLAGSRRAPDWFAALATPRETITRIAAPAPMPGAVLIAADPSDEIAEIWEEILGLALGGALVALAAFALVFIAISRTLAPVSALAQGLEALEKGERSLRVPRAGSPEFAAITDRINALAEALARLDAENRDLLRRMIHVQETERRDIARDLHDEMGPFLFAIRAGVGALRRKPQGAGVERDCERLDEQIAALQGVNRRILARLRPAALEELGLAGALDALVRGWRETHPQATITLSVADCALDEETALVAYRIAQEGLTNALRHAEARRVSIDVRPAGDRELRVRVDDDGTGLKPGWRHGLGLRGMSERIAALGGRLTFKSGAPKGATLEAALPLPGPGGAS